MPLVLRLCASSELERLVNRRRKRLNLVVAEAALDKVLYIKPYPIPMDNSYGKTVHILWKVLSIMHRKEPLPPCFPVAR